MPLAIPEFLSKRLALPVAVLGAGVSGDGALSLLSRIGARAVVYDRRGTEFTAERAHGHGLVVFSPGFSLHHPWLELARKAGCICMAEIDFASLFWLGGIVAVTGTNGKTTLTEFLAEAVGRSGRRARATGNIGLPFSQLVADEDGGTPNALAICEVSSFQAEQLGHLWADALLWTNFAEDHLERHAGLEAYFAAKWELVLRGAPGRFFGGSSVGRYAEKFARPMPAGSCVVTEGLPEDPRLAGTPFASYPMRENFVLAAAWWRSEGMDEALLYAAARTFRLGRHRLSNCASVDGVAFWNDSKATNFHAAEAALWPGCREPNVLIAGGQVKGGRPGRLRPQDLRPMSPTQSSSARPAPALASGTSRPAVSLTPICATALRMRFAPRPQAAAQPGGNVLLSPGFSSFDMFRDLRGTGRPL
jgi:UDP-N-acetylmuramoylalanine--D-glutamate ligase